MENKSLTIVSIVAAGLASLCCIGPLVVVGVGLGAARVTYDSSHTSVEQLVTAISKLGYEVKPQKAG